VDAGDGAGFADRVARVLGSEEVASSLAAAARAKIEAGFSVERMTSAVEEIYGRFF